MFCKQCGEPLTPGAKFCENCGTPAPENVLYSTVSQTREIVPAHAPRSRVAAGVLAILLGSLGVHNFYLGFTKRGLTQLLISLLTCGVGAIGMEIWALVEGIMLLSGSSNVDADGQPLRD